MYSFIFVLEHQDAPNLLKIAFQFPLQVTLVKCHESKMAFSQQVYLLDMEPFGTGCLNYYLLLPHSFVYYSVYKLTELKSY